MSGLVRTPFDLSSWKGEFAEGTGSGSDTGPGESQAQAWPAVRRWP